MVPTRYVSPTSLSPAAALHVWLAIFAASIGPPIALMMPLASDYAHVPCVGLVLGVLSVAAVQLLILIAKTRATALGAALSSLFAVPLAILVCAAGGAFVEGGPGGFILGGLFGLLVASPVGFFFAAVLAPVFHLAQRAQMSRALALRDRVHAIAALYASIGCGIAILLGEPAWFAVPAILSFGFAAERVWLSRARARWIAAAYAGNLPEYSVGTSELAEGAFLDLPRIGEGAHLHVLLVRDDPSNGLGAYRSHEVQRPLLRLP